MTASPIVTPPPAPPTGRHLALAAVPDREEAGLDRRAQRLASRFADWYGGPPAVMTAAPATVHLLGSPSGWGGGATLTSAVDRSALAAVDVGPDGQIGVLTDLDFPSGAGLGSRIAERVALRKAVDHLGRPDRLPWTAPELAARWGRPGTALLVDRDSADPVPVDLGDFSLLALDTGLRHLGGDSGLRDRQRAVRRVATLVDQVVGCEVPGLSDVERRCLRHLLGERDRIGRAAELLAAGDVAALGAVLLESQDSLRRELRVTSVQIDAVVAAAVRGGAVGARMLGAGFGGSVLTIVPRGLEDDVAAAVHVAAARAGFPSPRMLPLALTGRVRRLR